MTQKKNILVILAFVLSCSLSLPDDSTLQHYVSKMDDSFSQIVQLGNQLFKSTEWNYMHYQIETGLVTIGFNSKQNVPEDYVTIYFKIGNNLAYKRRVEESNELKRRNPSNPAIHHHFFKYYLNGAKALHTRLLLKGDSHIDKFSEEMMELCQADGKKEFIKIHDDHLREIKEELKQVVRQEFQALRISDLKDEIIEEKERRIRRMKAREDRLDKLINKYFDGEL